MLQIEFTPEAIEDDVDEENAVVKIEAIGYKEGSKLFVHGEEYEL